MSQATNSRRAADLDALLEANVGRSAAAGALVGFLLFTLFVGLLGKWTGLDDAGSLFLGVFTGFWGGLGFGVMVGSILAYHRHEKALENGTVDQQLTERAGVAS